MRTCRLWIVPGALGWFAIASCAQVTAQEQPSSAVRIAPQDQGPEFEVLTRGPVHEAFARVIQYDSVPGIVVNAAPPALIEEIPPGERPVGDDVTWIQGYWAWDE